MTRCCAIAEQEPFVTGWAPPKSSDKRDHANVFEPCPTRTADRNQILAPGKLEQAMRYINARGWRRKEPGADPKHEQPKMLRRLLQLAEEQGVSTQRIAGEQGIPTKYLHLIVPKPLPTLTL